MKGNRSAGNTVQKKHWIFRGMWSGMSQKSALKHSKNSTDTTGFKIKNFWMNNKEIIGFVFCVIWRIIQIPEYVIFLGLIECCLYWQERGPHFKSSAEYTYSDWLTLWSYFTSCFCKIYSKINSKCLWNVFFSVVLQSPSLGGYTVTPSTQFISFLVSTLTKSFVIFVI